MKPIIPQNKFYVYQLRLENSDLPFYIGKGKGNRIIHHFRASSLASDTRKNHIIKKAIKSRINIFREKLYENLVEQDAFDLEMHYIAMYGRLDLGTGILANHTDGGDGVSGYKHTPEAMIKMSYIQKGRTHSEETRLKMSASASGKVKTTEHIKKLAASRIGHRHSEESKLKIKLATSTTFSNIAPWLRCKDLDNIQLVWSHAIQLYEFYICGSDTPAKLGTIINANRNKLKGIVKEFKKGWNPNNDPRWIEFFKK